MSIFLLYIFLENLTLDLKSLFVLVFITLVDDQHDRHSGFFLLLHSEVGLVRIALV